jgi:lipopolysaccharide export system protein LptA
LKKYILYIAFVLIGLQPDVSAQNLVRLLSSDQAITTNRNGEQIRKLYNARLSMGDVTMVCDSAWQFLDKQELQAFGNIQIDTSTENIWADTLYYYTNEDLSKLRGRVVIHQDTTRLFGKEVDYNFLTKVAYFRNGIRLEDDDGVLTANTGTYFQNQDSAIFRQHVQIADSAQYAEGDSLFINRQTEYLELYSNIFVVDSTNNGLLMGDYLEADSTGRRYVDGNGYLRKIDTDSLTSDTTHIYGDELLMIDNDSTDTISGFGNVKTWSPDFSSLSDSMFYDSSTELFRLIGDPKAWHDNIQLTGPFISVQMDSNQVKELKSYFGAFAVQEDSATGRLHQLKGDTLFAYFDAGDISSIEIYPNSEVLYHTKNDEGQADGAMESSSPKTVLLFENGQLAQARMGQNKGFFLPEYDELPQRKLEGFQWNPESRPQKPGTIPQPKWDPISTERPFELPRRYKEFIKEQVSDKQ